MANIQAKNFTPKTTPILADGVYVTNSAASGQEVLSTIGELQTAIVEPAAIAANFEPLLLPTKATPVLADIVVLGDSTDTFSAATSTLTALQAAIVATGTSAATASAPATVVGSLSALTLKSTPAPADIFIVGDSAAAFANKKVTGTSLQSLFGGAVSSVAVASPSSTLAISGSPITTTGTINADLSPGTIATKSTPVLADLAVIGDSAAANAPKTSTLTQLQTTLVTSAAVNPALAINSFASKGSPVAADEFIIGDSTSSFASKKTTGTALQALFGAPLTLQTNGVTNALQTLLDVDTSAGIVDGVNPISASQITPGVTTFSVENTFVVSGTGTITDTYTVNDSLCGKRIYFDDTSPSTPKTIAFSNAGMDLFGLAQGPVMICNSQLNAHPVTFTLPADMTYTYSLVPANAIIPPGMSAIVTTNVNHTATELYYCVEVLDGYAGTPAAQNLFLATPNGSSGVPVLRAIASADLPATIAANTTGNADTATLATTATNVTNTPTFTDKTSAVDAQTFTNFNSGVTVLAANATRNLVAKNVSFNVTTTFTGADTIELTDASNNLIASFPAATLVAPGLYTISAVNTPGPFLDSPTVNSALKLKSASGVLAGGAANVRLTYYFTT